MPAADRFFVEMINRGRARVSRPKRHAIDGFLARRPELNTHRAGSMIAEADEGARGRSSRRVARQFFSTSRHPHCWRLDVYRATGRKIGPGAGKREIYIIGDRLAVGPPCRRLAPNG